MRLSGRTDRSAAGERGPGRAAERVSDPGDAVRPGRDDERRRARENEAQLDDRLNLRQFYAVYFPVIEQALLHAPNTAVNATLLAIELVTAFLPIHQTFLRGVFTAGKLLETLMMKLPMDCVPSVSMVIRCGRNGETGFRVAVIRLLSVGIGLQSSWFSTILVHRGLLRFVYALTTPEILLKDSLLAASLRNFFQWALLNHHIEVLLDVAEKVPNLGIAEITPFSDILQFVREKPASELVEKVVAFFGIPEIERNAGGIGGRTVFGFGEF